MSQTQPSPDFALPADAILPFAVHALDVRGRAVRLAGSLDDILRAHAYPEPVSRLVGEALVLCALLGGALKGDGRFQLQTSTDGPVAMIVVDFETPDRLRAFARYDADRLAADDAAAPLGKGHMALTIEQPGLDSRYQGVVALDGQGFEQAALQYFQQSEQIPTLVRLAVAQDIRQDGTHWTGGGLLIQFLPSSPERLRQLDLAPGDAPPGVIVDEKAEDDSWTEARLLAATVQDHELVDPTLASEALLYRLFHQRGVNVFEPEPVRSQCRCSSERVESMLRSFTKQDRRDMVAPSGKIVVTCEFCSTAREFAPSDFDP